MGVPVVTGALEISMAFPSARLAFSARLLLHVR
jgi:hypothetical protein